MSMVIYLLSNDLIRHKYHPYSQDTMSGILEIAFTFVSRRLLSALLHSRLPSIKATWEQLLFGAQRFKNEEAFRFLITIGMENDWLDEYHQGYEYLVSAARMGCSDIFSTLTDRGCRIDKCSHWCYNESIILEALENGNLDLVQLLIQTNDVNTEFQAGLYTSTHFVTLIMNLDDTRPDHIHCLDLCLQHNADVNYEIDPSHPMARHREFWYEIWQYKLNEDWPLTILDYIYYWHRQLFPKLAKYGGVPLKFSRSKALWSLDQGVGVLQEYLTWDSDFAKHQGQATANDPNDADIRQRQNHCLEVLFAEQFLLSIRVPEETVWWSRVKGLSELEIDLTWLSKTDGLSANMLYTTARLITSDKESDKDSGLHLMRWLLGRGFKVKADALGAAINDNQLAILECLASFCVDLGKEGGEALVWAVYDDKFDAAKWLLDKGVDPNSTTCQGPNVFEAAACGSSLAMMKYLVQRGAKMRDWKADVLELMIGELTLEHCHEMFDKFQYIIENHMPIDELSYPSSRLLEICLAENVLHLEQGRTLFEFLFKKGARLQPGSPLAVWIATGGGHQLVQDMLNAGADPNAHSFDTSSTPDGFINTSRTPLQAAAGMGDYALVCTLMERGADVNRPALGHRGMTALQAICAWDPVRREETLRKDKIITLLLDRGADVNATNSNRCTALIYAAQLGDMLSAFRLLKHGAKVNLATSSYGYPWAGTALDTAAMNGRLDMVNFLLNAGALSSSACSEGKEYDRAIQLAMGAGRFVVSDLICKHLADGEREWAAPPERAVETRTPHEHTLSLSLRAQSGTASYPQPETPTPSEHLQRVAVLDECVGLSYALDENMAESSIFASTAETEGVGGAEVTDMSWTRVIEEVEDEAPPADTGCERTIGGQGDWSPNQALDSTGKASSGLGGWLYQPREQNWVDDEQQNADLLVSSSMAVDVFMGSSEFPSP